MRTILPFLVLAVTGAAAATAQAPGSPPARAHHAMVYDAAGSRVLLAGGSTPAEGGHRFFDDVWAFDGAAWTRLEVSGPGQSGQRLATDPATGAILSFGGFRGRTALGHLLALEPGADTWRPGPFPAGLTVAEGGFVRDSRRDSFVAFGGTAAGGLTHGDTWELADGRWHRVDVEGPAARHSFAMAYDSARGVSVLFGGMDAEGALLGDTWVYDGASWQRVGGDGSAAPAPRAAMAFAYDTRRARLLIFGGITADGFAGDTWAWHGTSWTRLAEEGPGARTIAAMAYDAGRDRVVLFGGRETNPMQDLADTWEWDGARWRRVR